MSLVITSNRDSDRAKRQEESVYSAWSYRNGLSSTYNIPANSQVCLQSAKVNLDGRTTLNQNNSWFYTWHGKALAQEIIFLNYKPKNLQIGLIQHIENTTQTL